MAKFTKIKQLVRRTGTPKNKPSGATGNQQLKKVQKNIYRQAILAGLTVVLTIVIVFAMTSAWYVNVVETSGLVFQTEAWGFDGDIHVNDAAILAAPGDEGVVYLTAKNDSDTMSAISVNVSKSEMNDEMQKRLFFYVDTPMSRNGENMERVYLNKYEGYTYNVFSNSQLTLTDQFHNAPQIKWEWVYDVLGYYVLAQPYEIQTVQTVEQDGETVEQTVTTKSISIREYLRPIEYDFDEATTVINTQGEAISVDISTVDGTTNPEAFLLELSKKDGYEGRIDVDSKDNFGKYYAVDVDENGYGVYAYLCNYSEIQRATEYDTLLGQLAYDQAKGNPLSDDQQKLLTHKAVLTLSAQKDEGTTLSVNTLGALRSAMELDSVDIIQLGSNITLGAGETLTIPADADVMLDLNGYTLTDLDGTAIKAEPGSCLTMINGAIARDTTQETGSATTYGVYATGAEVVMNEVDITGFKYGFYVGDNVNSNEQDSRVYLVDSKINAENWAVFVSGNGVLSEQRTQLIIENCDLTSSSIVISGNGDSSGNGRWGTDIQITSSRITLAEGAKGACIYHPQKNSTLTIYDSVVEGYGGIAIKGGEVSVMNTEVIATGAYQEPELGGSGFTDTGDAVYIETGYGYEIRLVIGQNSTLTTNVSDNDTRSLRVFEEGKDYVSVLIESGTFDEEQPEEYLDNGSAQSKDIGTGEWKVVSSQ